MDFSSVLIANLHAQIGIHNMKEVDENLLRHMILNTIRSIRVKFKKEGELIIACDRGSWRKGVYPYYKANRAKAKSESDLDWRAIFEVFNKVRDDLKEHFPYRVITVENAEADDVIGTLVDKFGNDLPLAGGENILIMSPDKDFAQLHRYSNVQQYDPIRKKYITHSNPNEYLLEHVIKGDSGDGVPNILSDDDTLVVPGKRQKPMTAKRLAQLKEAFHNPQLSTADAETDERFWRNLKLIDLRYTPNEIRDRILSEYEAQAGKNRSKIFNYLMNNSLRNLMESVQEF